MLPLLTENGGGGWVAEKTVTYAFAACIFQGFLGKALNYTRKDEEESRRQLLPNSLPHPTLRL